MTCQICSNLWDHCVSLITASLHIEYIQIEFPNIDLKINVQFEVSFQTSHDKLSRTYPDPEHVMVRYSLGRSHFKQLIKLYRGTSITV